MGEDNAFTGSVSAGGQLSIENVNGSIELNVPADISANDTSEAPAVQAGTDEASKTDAPSAEAMTDAAEAPDAELVTFVVYTLPGMFQDLPAFRIYIF